MTIIEAGPIHASRDESPAFIYPMEYATHPSIDHAASLPFSLVPGQACAIPSKEPKNRGVPFLLLSIADSVIGRARIIPFRTPVEPPGERCLASLSQTQQLPVQ